MRRGMLIGYLCSLSCGQQEWLPSTPKHIALYNAFGWTPPQFAHMPILVSPSGKKMSKRDGEVHVEQYLVSQSVALGLLSPQAKIAIEHFL